MDYFVKNRARGVGRGVSRGFRKTPVKFGLLKYPGDTIQFGYSKVQLIVMTQHFSINYFHLSEKMSRGNMSPFKNLFKRSIYSNRAVSIILYSNRAVMCSL